MIKSSNQSLIDRTNLYFQKLSCAGQKQHLLPLLPNNGTLLEIRQKAPQSAQQNNDPLQLTTKIV